MSQVVFDAVAHRYTLPNGRILPSVTQVIHEAGLVDTTWFTDEARERGTAVHLAIALGDDLDFEALDDRLRPYVDGWRAFLVDTRAEVLVTERRVCDPVAGYAGTLDSILRMPDLGDYLIDVKSGGLPATVGLQTAAYRRAYLLDQMTPTPLRRGCVHLPGDGSYRFVQLTDRQDEATFLAALRISLWKRQHS